MLDEILPMSWSKLPSLLSYPSWRISSSTRNICSEDSSVSFNALFPKKTDRRRTLVPALDRGWRGGGIMNISPTMHRRKFTAEHVVVHTRGSSPHPSGKQWAADSTQQGAIRLPPHRNTRRRVLVDQNMAATHGWDSTVVTVPPTIFIRLLFR